MDIHNTWPCMCVYLYVHIYTQLDTAEERECGRRLTKKYLLGSIDGQRKLHSKKGQSYCLRKKKKKKSLQAVIDLEADGD